jgi:hypothetical protein
MIPDSTKRRQYVPIEFENSGQWKEGSRVDCDWVGAVPQSLTVKLVHRFCLTDLE